MGSTVGNIVGDLVVGTIDGTIDDAIDGFTVGVSDEGIPDGSFEILGIPETEGELDGAVDKTVN